MGGKQDRTLFKRDVEARKAEERGERPKEEPEAVRLKRLRATGHAGAGVDPRSIRRAARRDYDAAWAAITGGVR